MKIGDLVKTVRAEVGIGIVIQLLAHDYWGDTAIVLWNDGEFFEHQQAHLEVVSENR